MAPPMARKRKSDEMDNGPSTPTGSPRKKMRITQAQKQALIDNLQLEVSERARQLRAQYALQCQDLRSRIERRINRVPVALRKMKMGDLLAQQEAKSKSPAKQPPVRSPLKPRIEERPLPAPPSPSKLPSPLRQPVIHSQKSRKRKSSAIHIPSDKENTETDTSNNALDALPVQKNAKRAKTAATAAPTVPKRTTSRAQKKPAGTKDVPSGVLSPRSHNSRAFPRSPIKDKELPVPPAPASPLRQQQQQAPAPPLSPTKPQSPFKIAANAGMSAISAFAKRGYAAAGAASAKIGRPISREKDQPILSGTGTAIPVPTSPTGKMLPPARPALATLTSTSVSSIPTLSPQRTASQASVRSNASGHSTTSTNATVITKPTRGATLKKAIGASGKVASAKKITTTTTAASRTKQKIVVSGSTTSTVSPKAVKMAPTTSSTAAAKKATTAAAARKAAATPAPTGRVLRKRN